LKCSQFFSAYWSYFSWQNTSADIPPSLPGGGIFQYVVPWGNVNEKGRLRKDEEKMKLKRCNIIAKKLRKNKGRKGAVGGKYIFGGGGEVVFGPIYTS
jgi:hypothetical protein